MSDTSNTTENVQTSGTAGLLSDANLTRMRIVSGIILFVYIVLHFINHALGLISDDVMREMAGVMKSFVRFLPVTIILYGAVAVHILASLWRVYQRRSLKMPAREWLQLLLGLAIPYLIIAHIMGTRYAAEAYDLNDTYEYVLLSIFFFNTNKAIADSLGLIAAWVHACVGLHMWFQTKLWYTARIRSVLLVFATLLPTLSLAGVLSAGRRMIPKATDGEFMGGFYERLNVASDTIFDFIARDILWVELFFLSLIVIVALARLIRHFVTKTNKNITIDYIDGPKLQQPIGSTLLEMSKIGGIPHASVCGGRGRCSTCRVRILTPSPSVDPASDEEQVVLDRVRAPQDVRLACQMHPRGNLQVMRLLPSDASRTTSADREPWSSGQEKTITVMFADLRDFTKTSESRLPFDVVYLINQFSQAMGQAVENENGRIDKFLGDGFMALFGVDESAKHGARHALEAAGKMIEELEALNGRLASDLSDPLRMGIGIHTGSVILGNMGYGSSRGLTAIGDTVNTASRLEAATKEQNCILCVSANTVATAQLDAPDETKKNISIRGKKKKQEIHALMNVKSLNATDTTNTSEMA